MVEQVEGLRSQLEIETLSDRERLCHGCIYVDQVGSKERVSLNVSKGADLRATVRAGYLPVGCHQGNRRKERNGVAGWTEFSNYSNDGWPDIYIACDSTPSILYRNNKDGTFTDVGAETGVAFDEDGREQAGMGSSVADYNGDGLPDIFKTNFSDDTSSLYLNNGDGTFTPTIFDAGLGFNTRYLGWGAMFIDVDNAGWPDILIVNGHVYPEVDSAHLGSNYKEPRLLYYNLQNGKFRDLSQQCGPGCSEPESSRGMAIADFWNDGRISAVVNNMSGHPMLLVNMAANANHWLGFVLQGTQSNRDGIGAQVTVAAGTRKLVQEVRSGSSYISSNDLRLHFGLGATTKIDNISVRWPSGRSEMFTVGKVDRFVTLIEGTGKQLP